MNAYWMNDSASVGEVVTSSTYNGFRNRLVTRKLGRINGARVEFSEAAGIALFETTLELTRLKHFPDHPSRLQSLFLWESIADARKYHNGVDYARIFEVEIIESIKLFRADYNLITYYPKSMNLQGFLEIADRYWRAEDDPEIKELLLYGSIRLIRAIGRDAL